MSRGQEIIANPLFKSSSKYLITLNNHFIILAILSVSVSVAFGDTSWAYFNILYCIYFDNINEQTGVKLWTGSW